MYVVEFWSELKGDWHVAGVSYWTVEAFAVNYAHDLEYLRGHVVRVRWYGTSIELESVIEPFAIDLPLVLTLTGANVTPRGRLASKAQFDERS